MKKTYIFLAACVFFSTAVAGMPIINESLLMSRVKDSVRSKLSDPESAKFRNLHKYILTDKLKEQRVYVCGEVNARNGFGGYTGYKRFFFIIEKDGKEDVIFGEDMSPLIPEEAMAMWWRDMCKEQLLELPEMVKKAEKKIISKSSAVKEPKKSTKPPPPKLSQEEINAMREKYNPKYQKAD